MANTNDDLIWLQSWYLSNCDGEWEHGYGVAIDTLDPWLACQTALTATLPWGRR